MTILLQWLVEHAWIFYVVCAIGIIVYVMRALAAQRDRSLAMFTLERDMSTTRVVQAWATVLILVATGVAIFVSTTVILPGLPIYGSGTPPPSPTLSAGVEPLTPTSTPTPGPTLESLAPTLTSLTAAAPVSTPPPPESIETPTPEPTDTPEAAASGELYVRFGDFAELVGYNLPAATVSAAQPLQITLYWRALKGTSPTGYMVFTHLLSGDGRLIAQHDGAPAGGARPTNDWIPGETIVDLHQITFYGTAYAGPARIAVGLYDPATGRVLTGTGDDQVILPITISITP